MVGPYAVPVESDHGEALVVLPYVAARDINALWVTAIIVATKAVYDVKEHTQSAKDAASAAQRKLQVENLRLIKWEPPLQRFQCEYCEDVWDAWIAEDGSLEDPRSCACTNEKCANHGGPAVLARDS